MYKITSENSKNVVALPSKREDKTHQDEQTAQSSTVCQNGVCRIEWKPVRPAQSTNAA